MTQTKTKSNPMLSFMFKTERKLHYFWILAVGFIFECLQTVPVYADGTLSAPDTISLASDVKGDTVFGKVAGLVLVIMRYAGVILALLGIAKLVIALNNDQADQIKGSIMMIGTGIVLVILKTLLGANGLGLIA